MPTDNQIQRGDLLQRLIRGLEIKGQRSAALALESTVVPIVILEDLTRDLTEDPRAPGWFYSQRIPAVAGELGIIAIINTSQDPCVVERMQITAQAGLDFDVFTSTDAAITAATGFTEFAAWGDTRLAAVPPLAGSFGSQAGGVGVIENFIHRTRFTLGGSPTDVWGPVILGPAKGLVIQCTAANALFNAAFSGRIALLS